MMVFMVLMINTAAGEGSGWAKPEGLFYPLKIWMEKLSLNFIFDQMEELNGVIKKDTDNATKNMRARIKERVENHTNRTKALNSQGRISVIQQSIIEAGSGGSRIAVSSVNGNISVHTEGGNATVTRDGGNTTVISVTNNSRQIVVISSSQSNSRSSRVSVRSEASVGD